jgi:hypothetical protein
MTAKTDLLGRALAKDDLELLDLYARLKALSARTDLPPVVIANARQAMVMVWNACNDLALIAEEPGAD